MQKHSRLTWVLGGILGGLVLLAILVVGGTFIYIHFIEGPAPKPLALPKTTTPQHRGGSTSPTSSEPSPTGTWHATAASVVGYRANEVLFGQNNVAVGRTHSVTGSITVGGSEVSAAGFTAQMATVHSDQSQRDDQFDGRIMDVAQFPTATFTLTRPIDLGTTPALGVTVHKSATGKLMLHGQTRTVSFPVTARYTGTSIDVAGSIPVTFADYGIGSPSFGGTITVEDHGTLEFLLILGRGAAS